MTTLQINSGDVQLLDDKIIINDTSGRQSAQKFKVFPFLFLLFAAFTLNKAINAPNDKISYLFLISGVLFLLTFILINGLDFKKINDKEIMLADIDDVKFKKQFGSTFLLIQLKNSKRRRIYNFKKEDFSALEKFFVEKNINVTQ